MDWQTAWLTCIAHWRTRDKGPDWSFARVLEDRIWAYQPTAGDFDAAEALLKKHGF